MGQQPQRHLRIVDAETGEALDRCPSCEALETEKKGWITRYQELKRQLELDAHEHELWPRGVKLFDIWRQLTGHIRSEWTAARFWMAVPDMRRYPDYTIERAIAGIAHEPFITKNREGREVRHDHWETLFRKQNSIEWYANAAPKDYAAPPRLSVTELAKRHAQFILDRAGLLKEAEDPAAIAAIFVELDRRNREWLNP